jgi:hypothetical protein
VTAPDRAFDGFSLALGEVYGLRIWRMDEYGRLRALHLPNVPAWRPGVNTAECRVDEANKVAPGWMPPGYVAMYAAGGIVVMPEVLRPGPEHPAPDEGCRCGFYAYTCPGPDLQYAHQDGFVLGVIRGTGRTLIGAKGFRCEKAEIVALLEPTAEGAQAGWIAWRRSQLRAVYPEIPLLRSREELLGFASIESTAPAVDSDEFWSLP